MNKEDKYNEGNFRLTYKEIDVGDYVSINFNNAKMTLTANAEVLYRPCAVGDSWRFRDTATNQLYYVSEGCTITLLAKGELK